MMLRGTSRVRVERADDLLRRLCEHFAEHGEVEATGKGARIAFFYGTAIMEADGECLDLAAEAEDAVYLSYVKMGLAEHVIEMAEGERPVIRWEGDGAGAIAVPPFFREMRVAAARTLTPHMRRVTLEGRDLARFAEGGLHVRLLFPPEGRVPVWPSLGEDGCIEWPGGDDALQNRIYTIRSIDPARGTVDIDIVLHEGEETPGSRFALNARPGDIVGMTGPGGGHFPEARSLLLVGDETALPAISRILEALPEDARAKVLVEVDGPADEQAFRSRATVEAAFLHRNGAPGGTCGLLPRAVRETDLAALGERAFVWAACEFSDFRAIRTHLRKERRMAKADHLVVAYWRRNMAGDAALAED